MSSALSYHNFKSTKIGHKPGVVGFVVGTAAGYGTGFGLGALHATHRDKWYGKYAPYIVAIGGKTVAAAAAAMGHGTTATIANDVGQSAVAILGANRGIKWALKRKGQRAVVVSEEAAAKMAQADMLGQLNESTARGMDRDASDSLYLQYT